MSSRIRENEARPSTLNTFAGADSEDQNIKINGLEQVIELFRYADPQFRASLLKRMSARDPVLAQKLLKLLRNS